MLRSKVVSLKQAALVCCIAAGLNQMGVASTTALSANGVDSAQNMSVAQSRQHILAALSQQKAPVYLSSLASLYAMHHMQPLWQDEQAVHAFSQQLAEVALSGVNPQFSRWVEQLADGKADGMARDILLSDAMLGYLQFVSQVPTQGESWLYGMASYKLMPPPSSFIKRWQTAIDDGQLSSFIASLAPQHPLYPAMHQALKTLLADADSAPWPRLKSTQTLRAGDRSDDIASLREILRRSGMLSETRPVTQTPPDTQALSVTSAEAGRDVIGSSATVDEQNDALQRNFVSNDAVSTEKSDNVYSDELVEAVKRFQKWQGLQPDGSVGPRTREWLNVSPQLRAALLALNMQRLRLLHNDMRNGLMVNIPNFSLVYYADGEEILSSRVIVGRPDRKTPLMHSELHNVVLNPPWNVPVTLVRKDIIPKVKRDPGYLSRHNYTVLSGWSGDAQPINPARIDWRSMTAESFPYRLRQAPGAGNSLGRYKFNMPSSDAIYLHDTPNHTLFRKENRALSSGCVRVSKAADLARLLLKNAGWSESRIAGSIKEGNTRYVPVARRIPVSLYYLTAWANDNNQPQFRSDIYNYDASARQGVQIVKQAGKLFL